MSISTKIDYPQAWLSLPLQEGYGLKPVSPLLRTTMTTGRARQRRLYTSTPTQAAVAWLFNDSQAQIFEAWFRDVLGDGARWFNMQLKTPVGLRQYVCRFVDIYDGPILSGGRLWRFTATLELWERPLLPPGWGFYPELLSGASIIDIAINREWPEA